MSIVNEVKEAIQVLKLNKLKMADVARRKDSLKWGIVFIAVPAVVNVILSAIAFPSGFGGIFSRYLLWPVVIPALSFAATAFLVSYVAEKGFHGQKDHVGFFKIMAYASVALWITIIPSILMVLGLADMLGSLSQLISLAASAWVLYVTYFALMEHHKLTKENSILTIVAAVVISIIVSGLLGGILVGNGYRFM
jgi:hypothetical protein